MVLNTFLTLLLSMGPYGRQVVASLEYTLVSIPTDLVDAFQVCLAFSIKTTLLTSIDIVNHVSSSS